jgi:hypothetical protein
MEPLLIELGTGRNTGRFYSAALEGFVALLLQELDLRPD